MTSVLYPTLTWSDPLGANEVHVVLRIGGGVFLLRFAQKLVDPRLIRMDFFTRDLDVPGPEALSMGVDVGCRL